MSLVVGIQHGDKVYMGADSIGVYVESGDMAARRDCKMFKNGDALIGSVGSARVRQILEHELEVPHWHKGTGQAFLVKEFIGAVRIALRNNGMLEVDKGVEGIHAEFLLGYYGQLFRVCSDLQVAECFNGYSAVGAGDTYASGSLHTTSHRAAIA